MFSQHSGWSLLYQDLGWPGYWVTLEWLWSVNPSFPSPGLDRHSIHCLTHILTVLPLRETQLSTSRGEWGCSHNPSAFLTSPLSFPLAPRHLCLSLGNCSKDMNLCRLVLNRLIPRGGCQAELWLSCLHLCQSPFFTTSLGPAGLCRQQTDS